MAVSVSYPGVYIQELPSGSRAIVGVPTSVAAFVGFTARGPVNEPAQIFSFADFERRFGGLDLESDLCYAVSQFFLNGGATPGSCGSPPAAAAADGAPGGAVTLTAIAPPKGCGATPLVLASTTTRPIRRAYSTSPSPRVQQQWTAVRRAPRPTATSRWTPRRDLCRRRGQRRLGPHPATTNRTRSGGGNGDERPADRCRGRRTQRQPRRLAISFDGGPVHEFDLFGEGESIATLASMATAITTMVACRAGIGLDDFAADMDGRQIPRPRAPPRRSASCSRRASCAAPRPCCRSGPPMAAARSRAPPPRARHRPAPAARAPGLRCQHVQRRRRPDSRPRQTSTAPRSTR